MPGKINATVEVSLKNAKAAHRAMLLSLRMGNGETAESHRSVRESWLASARSRYIRDRKFS